MPEPAPEPIGLRTVAAVFLRLGLIGFGGPAAHIALMQDELVVRRAWIGEQAFLDALGVTNLIPGPNSSEMAIHIGQFVAGGLGGVVAGVCFALPAFVLMTGLAAVYFSIGGFSMTADLFAGLQAVAVAVIVVAAWRLRRAATGWLPALVAAAALGMTIWLPGLGAVWILGGGVLTLGAWAWRHRGDRRRRRRRRPGDDRGPALMSVAGVLPLAAAWRLLAATTLGLAALPALAWVFLKTGALLFGGAYVLVPLLGPDVQARGWLTHAQFLDGIALGQATPGPIVTASAFVGYRVGGVLGALVATVAVYLPAFVIVLAGSGPILRSFRDRPGMRAAAAGLNAAALGAILAAAISLGRVGLASPARVLIGAAALVALLRNVPVWAVLVGGVALSLLAAALQ